MDQLRLLVPVSTVICDADGRITVAGTILIKNKFKCKNACPSNEAGFQRAAQFNG
jgi:hypothetical protein